MACRSSNSAISKSIEQLKDANIPALAARVDEGWDIVTPIPSCTLMFKQELPLLFPDDPLVKKVQDAMFDPFEYLWDALQGRTAEHRLSAAVGKVSYHVPCHLRVQNIGLKTRDVLMLVPGTQVEADRALLRPQRHLRCEDASFATYR